MRDEGCEAALPVMDARSKFGTRNGPSAAGSASVSNGLWATPRYAEPAPGTTRGIITYAGRCGDLWPSCRDTIEPQLGWMFSSGLGPEG